MIGQLGKYKKQDMPPDRARIRNIIGHTVYEKKHDMLKNKTVQHMHFWLRISLKIRWAT
jgi:hypothetical protein